MTYVQEQPYTCLPHYAKINSKWKKDPSIRHEILKIPERLQDTVMSMGFCKINKVAQETISQLNNKENLACACRHVCTLTHRKWNFLKAKVKL